MKGTVNCDASQSLSIWDGKWCLEGSGGRFETLYFDGVSAGASRVHRWGSRVIVVEFAPDGGGTTYVLKATSEVADADAKAFIASLSDVWLRRYSQEAKENDN